MHKKDSEYHVSGKCFSKEDLLQLCDDELADVQISTFKRALYSFIKEWFSFTEYVIANTSGSTGKPREIKLLKKHMIASAQATISYFNLSKKDKVLLCLPLHFIAGKMMVVRALVGGLDLYVSEPSSNPEIPETDIQFSAMVPLQVTNLLKEHPDVFTQIEKLIIGGSFIPDQLLQQLKQINTQVWHTYGMTETITHVAVRKINGTGKGEMYSALPGVSLSLDNDCIVVNAPHLGICDLKTNDLAEMDQVGRFRITGRADNVMISGGLKLFPEKIEQKISGLLSEDYFIGGLNDPKLGKRMVLFIEKNSHIERQIFNLWLKLEEKLEKYEVPKEIAFLKAFTKTKTGKTDRQATIAQYEMTSS